MLLDDKDKDGGLSADDSSAAALSTSLNSITLPAKDQSYPALSSDQASITRQIPIPIKDQSSSAPLENTASSTNVPASEPDKDKTAKFTALDDSSSSPKSEATVLTVSTLPSSLEKDKIGVTPYLPTVTSATIKDDGLVSATAIFSTSKDENQVSSSLVTANYDKQSNVAASGSSDLTIPDKDRTSSKAYDTTSSLSLSDSPAFTVLDKDKPTPTASEKHENTNSPGFPALEASTASDHFKSSSELLRTTERTATIPPKSSTSQSLPEKDKSASTSETINEKPYSSFVTPISSAPEKDQTSSTLQGSSPVSVPAQHTTTIPAKNEARTSSDVTSTNFAPNQEQTVGSLPVEYQKSSSSPSLLSSGQETSSRYVPDKDKTSALSQVTSSASTPDEDKTSVSSQVPSITIPLSSSKDQATSSIALTNDQTIVFGIPSSYRQTSSLVPVESSLSGPSRLYDSKTVSPSIPGSLLYASVVTLSSGPTNAQPTLTTTDSIPAKDQSLATSTATHSLPAKDQTSPTPSAFIPVTNKNISVAVTSSHSTPTQGARESILSKVLLSFGISTPPKHEQLETASNNGETSLFPATVTSLSDAVGTPAFLQASTGIASVSVPSTISGLPLITPKPGTLRQNTVPYPDQSLDSASRERFLNTSRVIPVWTPAMLGNAYGGGYITTPSVFVTSFPNSLKSSNGIPPGYGLSSKSEDIQPSNYVPTPVVTKLEGSATAFPSASTTPSVFTESKDETNKLSDSITPSVALKVEGRSTTYPGAGTPTTLFTKPKDESNKSRESGTLSGAIKIEGSTSAFPGPVTPPSIFTESKDETNKPSDSLTPSAALKVEGSTTVYSGANSPTALFTKQEAESNKASESVPPSVALKVEESTDEFPSPGAPTGLSTRSRDETSKSSDSLTSPVVNKLEGSTAAISSVSTPTALFTESTNESNKPSGSTTPPKTSLIADKPKDQTGGRVQTQAEIPKSSNPEQKEQTVTSGPSASLSISRTYNFASPSADSKDELDKSASVTPISTSLSDDLPGKTLLPYQPSSVRDNDEADKTSGLASVDIPNSSKVTLSTTTVSKDETDELITSTLPPSAGASVARISLSPLEPGYNASIIAASSPTSVLEFEGLASKYSTMSVSWGLITVVTVIIFF